MPAPLSPNRGSGIHLRITLQNDKRFQRRLARAPRKAMTAAAWQINDAAEYLVNIAKKTTRGSRTRANRMGRSVTAPKDILGVDYGTGRKSITRTKKATTSRLTAEVGSNVDYMNYHEAKGTYRWLGPAVETAMPGIRDRLRKVYENI